VTGYPGSVEYVEWQLRMLHDHQYRMSVTFLPPPGDEWVCRRAASFQERREELEWELARLKREREVTP
jgi:hypothetical protein